MTRREIEFHAARLTSGSLPFRVGGRRFHLRTPTPDAVMIAREVWDEAYDSTLRHSLLGEDDGRRELARRRIFSPEDEILIAKIEGDVRDAQVRLYEARGSVEDVQIPRQFLAQARAEVARLEALRAALAETTPESFAGRVAHRFLVGCSVRLPDGTPHWRNPDLDRIRDSDVVVDAAVAASAAATLPMSGIRELARHPAWQATWGLRQAAAGLLDRPSCLLSDEAASLLQWSTIYENARRCDEPPEERVIDDDDMFDGWMAVRARMIEEQEARSRSGGGRSPSKDRDRLRDQIERSDEVFVMARRYEYGEETEGGVAVTEVVDVRSARSDVDARLTPTGRALRDSRLAYLQTDEAREMASLSKTGSLPEVLLPDRREQLSLDLETVKATWLEEKRLGLRK